MDELHRVIGALARDTYPIFLRPSASPIPGSDAEVTIALYRHPMRIAFERLVMADDVLSQLFRATPDRPSFVVRSTGEGSTVQLELFAPLLLKSGWRAMSRRSSVGSPAELQDAVWQMLNLVRDGLSGSGGRVRGYVGLTGLRIPSDVDLDLTFGRIRPTTPSEYERSGVMIPGRLTTTIPDGGTVEIAYSGDVVLELDLPYRVRVEESWEVHGPLPTEARDRVTSASESVRLGAVLALDIADSAGVLNTWTEIEDPLSWGGASWRDPSRITLVPRELTSEEALQWADWVRLVDRERVPSIDVAVRRTLLATERGDPVDGLVDAVMAWENLFGSKIEVAHRVSASLAWLISSDVAERRTVYRDAARIYNLRSRIVHGSHVASEVCQRERLLALTFSRRAFRALFSRTELLRNFRDGTARSESLLLGGESAGSQLTPDGEQNDH
jgi:hypothetical protein